MRALITGINGFVGGHLAEYLLEQEGWEVWGVARKEHLRLPQLRGRARLVCLDLRDAAQVSECLKDVRPHVIFHLAGQAFVPESFNNPAATFQTNVFAQLNLLLALIEHTMTARVLVVSSYEVYGLVHPEDLPIAETAPLRPSNPYGVSKIAQDMLALQYHLSHGIDVVRVRPFNHIGPRQNERFVASSFAQQIARIEQGLLPPIIKVGNLTAQRDFTDVRDMVRAYVLAARHGESGAVYNIGSGQPVTIRALLDQLLAASSRPIEIEQDPARMRPIDIPVVVCDGRRFRACSGWEPRIAFAQTLHDILNDWRSRVSAP